MKRLRMKPKRSFNPHHLFLLSLLLVFCAGFLSSCASTKSVPAPAPEVAEKEKNTIRGPVVLTLLQDYTKVEKGLSRASRSKSKERMVLDRMLAQGLVPIQAKTLPSIIQEIQSGNPVAVRRRGRSEKNPVYELIVGIELRDEIVILKGEKELKRTSFDRFFNSWSQGGFWAYSFLEPSKIRATRDLSAVFAQALAMEKVSPAGARRVFQRLITLNENEADYLMALANNVSAKNKGRAIKLLEHAVKADPNRFEAWYNLAATQNLAGRKREAEATSRKIAEMFKQDEAPKGRLESLRLLATF